MGSDIRKWEMKKLKAERRESKWWNEVSITAFSFLVFFCSEDFGGHDNNEIAWEALQKKCSHLKGRRKLFCAAGDPMSFGWSMEFCRGLSSRLPSNAGAVVNLNQLVV
jgi:hypothetical protein